MEKKTRLRATADAALKKDSSPAADTPEVEKPASNPSQPLGKPPVRVKAHVDQTTIQEKGADALPVSDYPLKRGPSAANALDLQEQSRSRVKSS
ncbi:MAG: hypothetical protein ABI583_04005 [Betaproteobacteria bacterium]